MGIEQVAIVLYPGMTALDAIGPYEVLRFAPGVKVRFVGHELGPVLTDSGVLALGITHTFDETPNPDLVVVPGGPGAVAHAADKPLVRWLRAAHETSTWTTSVCTGALILAGAGLLHNAPATTHWAAQDVLAAYGAKPRRSERIVKHGRVATAAGASAGIDLALWLVGESFGSERAEAIQLDLEYDPRPPFDSGHPDKASAAVRRIALTDQFRLVNSNGTVYGNVTGVQKVLWRTMIRKIRG